MAVRLKPFLISRCSFPCSSSSSPIFQSSAKTKTMAKASSISPPNPKIIDSHLHIWASPQQAASEYPYFPGNEPTLPGSLDFLLESMGEAGVDGALIVQPINHKFDHSLITSVLKKHPSKFVGCCLANPAEDGSGIKQLEDLILKDGYRAVRFNPYLWSSGQKMTNEVGKAMFSKAGDLGVPVGFMCMKGLNLHISEIEDLCSEFPSTVVLLDHVAFCKPPINDEERVAFSRLLNLSKFPKVYVKFSALFRVSRELFPYEDTCQLLSEVVSSYGANRVMWGSDFPFVVPVCGYKGAKEAVAHVAGKIPLQSSDLEWIMGRSVMEIFPGHNRGFAGNPKEAEARALGRLQLRSLMMLMDCYNLASTLDRRPPLSPGALLLFTMISFWKLLSWKIINFILLVGKGTLVHIVWQFGEGMRPLLLYRPYHHTLSNFIFFMSQYQLGGA